MDWKNKLYFGDNLGILREHVATGSVDLIYLDPPFNSSASYNVLLEEKRGSHGTCAVSYFFGLVNEKMPTADDRCRGLPSVPRPGVVSAVWRG